MALATSAAFVDAGRPALAYRMRTRSISLDSQANQLDQPGLGAVDHPGADLEQGGGRGVVQDREMFALVGPAGDRDRGRAPGPFTGGERVVRTRGGGVQVVPEQPGAAAPNSHSPSGAELARMSGAARKLPPRCAATRTRRRTGGSAGVTGQRSRRPMSPCRRQLPRLGKEFGVRANAPEYAAPLATLRYVS
ncbi:hypothetical protein GCM10027436_14940 [Actinophytocola sediminis]